MIVFNNVRISQDDKYITIDAEIENNKYYEQHVSIERTNNGFVYKKEKYQ